MPSGYASRRLQRVIALSCHAVSVPASNPVSQHPVKNIIRDERERWMHYVPFSTVVNFEYDHRDGMHIFKRATIKTSSERSSDSWTTIYTLFRN